MLKKRYIGLIWLIFINFACDNVFSENIVKKKNYLIKNDKLSLVTDLKKSSYYSQKLLNKFLTEITENIVETSFEKEKNISSIEIISDLQVQNDNLFIAEGNVYARKNNLILKADKIQYDLIKKIILINGNIYFQAEDQFLVASEVKFDINQKKGHIIDAYGSVNFETIGLIQSNKKINENINPDENIDKKIKNVILNQTSSIGFEDINFLKEKKTILQKISSQKLKLDLNEMQKWRFQAAKININDNVWFSEKLYLTNDPYNQPQVIINNTDFTSINEDGEITIKSKWSSIKFDNRLTIPVGPRRIKSGDKTDEGSWSIGYDKPLKDGLFIIRSHKPLIFNKKTKLKLKNEFYIQRALFDKTKSFSEKNKSILDPKIEQDAKILDFFGLEAQLYSEIYGFDFESSIKLNSFDLQKIEKTLSSKSELSKIIYKQEKDDYQNQIKLIFFDSFREKVWNGSLGERDILNAYGVRIEKENKWITNKVSKSSLIAGGYGYYEASQRTDSLKAIKRRRLNLLLERNHRYPIWDPKREGSFNETYKYSPSIIPYGLNLFTYSKIDLYRYDDNNFQNLFTFKAGPELTLGEYKKKFFDYTKLSIYPKTTISSGKSPFGFDQAVDNHTLEISLKQQIIGALAIKYSSEYNLDVNSKKFHEFINTKYELSWNRRAFNLALYYDHERKGGGFTFKIHSFNFDGYGNKFK